MIPYEYERYAYIAMAKRRGYTKIDEVKHLLWLRHKVKGARLERLQRRRRLASIIKSPLYPVLGPWLGI